MLNTKMRVLQPVAFSAWLLMVGLTVTESATTNFTTTSGIMSGTVVTHQGVNVSVFYGIPYAKPPVGNLRFKAPEVAEPWTGVKEANIPPNSCWQTIDSSFNRSRSVEMWNANTNFSEDCLYLNIWVPEGNTPRAVMVWIYGGGFWGGTSTLAVYNALALAAMNNVIVVSLNYRVGPFGFLYCGTTDCPGNVGLLDQVLALKWVKNNAKNMEGDPARITIFGESAGAASVGFHLLSPLSRDLFNNAILMSSSPTVHWGIQPHEIALNRTQTLARLMDPSINSLSGTVSYLKSASPEMMIRTQWRLVNYYFDLPFAPVVDGNFLKNHPLSLIADGQVKNTSIITGVVKNEGTYWLLYGFSGIFGNRDPNPVSASQYDSVVQGLLRPLGSNFTLDSVKVFTKTEYYDSIPPWNRGSYLDSSDAICGDTLFKCPVVSFAQLYSNQVKGHVFMYSFEHRSSMIYWPKWVGAPHGYDVEFFFGRPWSEINNSYSNDERSLSDDLMTRISNFAKTGDPNTGAKSPNVTWPEYTADEQKYLVMNAGQMRVDQGLRYRECQFWETQVPLIQAATVPSAPCTGSAGSRFHWRTLFPIFGVIVSVVTNKY